MEQENIIKKHGVIRYKDGNFIYPFKVDFEAPIFFFKSSELLKGMEFNKEPKITSISFEGFEGIKALPNHFWDFGYMQTIFIEDVDLSGLSSLEHIGNKFLCNTSIKTIDLSPLSNVTSIGDNAFFNCEKLTEIDLKPLSNVTSIGVSFLEQCTSLKSLNLVPLKNVTKLDSSSIFHCCSLQDLTLPCGVRFKLKDHTKRLCTCCTCFHSLQYEEVRIANKGKSHVYYRTGMDLMIEGDTCFRETLLNCHSPITEKLCKYLFSGSESNYYNLVLENGESVNMVFTFNNYTNYTRYSKVRMGIRSINNK